jgi:NhaP-type Na+/H+ or K+/H+ antiporter
MAITSHSQAETSRWRMLEILLKVSVFIGLAFMVYFFISNQADSSSKIAIAASLTLLASIGSRRFRRSAPPS